MKGLELKSSKINSVKGILVLSGGRGRGISMTLTNQLKDVVENYFVKFPHMSVNSLAMKSGVGATTLRRIMNASIKGDPAPHTVLNIASAVTNEKRLSHLISMFEGPLGQMLQETFGPFVDAKSEHIFSANLNDELADEVKYFIYKMAANRTGVAWTWIADTFGKMGLEKMEEMKCSGLLNEKDNHLHAKDKNFSLNVQVAAKHLPSLVGFYKPEQVGEGRNLFYHFSETLNDEGIQKIKEIQKEAIRKAYEVFTKEEFMGEIPFFSLFLSDTLLLKGQGVVQ